MVISIVFSSRLRVTVFLQGCQYLYAQMLLLLQAKCSINIKHTLLHVLQNPTDIFTGSHHLNMHCICNTCDISRPKRAGKWSAQYRTAFSSHYINCFSRYNKKNGFNILTITMNSPKCGGGWKDAGDEIFIW